MMRSPRFYSSAWVLSILLTACTRWETYPVPLAATPALPSSLRVWASGRAGTVLGKPFVRRDTLYGRAQRDTLALALSSIERLERPRVDGVRTAGVILGGLAGWISLGVISGGLE